MEHMFDASIDLFVEAVADAACDALDNAGEDVLAMAADNVERGYEKPELGWPEAKPMTLIRHFLLKHIPLARKEYHRGLLHRKYEGILPNLYDSLFKGNLRNVFETSVERFGESGITAEGKYGTRFMAARRHEFGIGRSFPGEQPIPARPFMAPAIAEFVRNSVINGDQARYLASRLNLELTDRGLV